MRLYESGGKIFVGLDETIKLCTHRETDTIQEYREELLRKVGDLFDKTVAEAALKGMESKQIMPEKEPAETIPQDADATSGQEQPKKRRKPIDIGKVMALRNAGWSTGKIADEMGMQPQSVSNAIYQYKKKNSGDSS